MAAYGQNVGNIPPRNGTAPCRNAYPLSHPAYAPQEIPLSNENPSSVAGYGGYRAVPLPVAPQGGNFGRHDGLQGRLMEVAQADSYDARGSARWPAAGTYEEPGAATAVLQMMRLAPTTSAHPGLSFSTGAGPAMLFVTPPVMTMQTTPIYATGL